MSVSLRPWVLHSLLLPHLSIHPLFPCTSSRTSSTSLRAVAILCTPPKRVWTLFTTPTSFTGYEPKDYYLKETHVESYTESLTKPQFSEQGFLEDVTPHSRRCFAKHIEYISLSPCENGQSSLSVSERTERPVQRANGVTCWINWSGAKRC